MKITKKYYCLQCGAVLSEYRHEESVENKSPGEVQKEYWARHPIAFLYSKLDALEIGQCLSLMHEPRTQYGAQLCFKANRKFAPKRFTSRYNKETKRCSIYRITPGSEHDYNTKI